MILLVAIGINANDEIYPLAWALVPIKDKFWWAWFLLQLLAAIKPTNDHSIVYISDREKGIKLMVAIVFPSATYVYCCQHLADNL